MIFAKGLDERSPRALRIFDMNYDMDGLSKGMACRKG